MGGLSVFHLLRYRSSKAYEGSASDPVEFSSARYEPMARLMADDDLVFLRAQAGYCPEVGRKFSRERRRIFRLYLQQLASDFHRLHAHARAMVATLPAEHSALVGILLRQQVRFWYEMTAIEMRLSFDLIGGPVHVRGLVEALATMHSEIGRVTVMTAA
jgi:hypothetical protein